MTPKPKKGYKLAKSLFGRYEEIPEEWEIVSMEQICKKFTSGGTPSTNVLEYWDGDIPWTRSSILTNHYLEYGERCITKKGLDESSSVLIPQDNLLVSSRVSLGNLSINRIAVAISQDITAIIVDKSHISSEFLYWFLKQNIMLLTSYSQGTTIQGFTRKELSKFRVVLPPLPEQAKIASILSGVDALIEKTQEAIEKTEQVKRGLTQRLLTNGIAGTKLKKTFLGKIAKFSSGEFLPTKNYNFGKIPVYGGNGVVGYHDKELIKHDTIIFGRVGAYCGSVHISRDKSWITDNAIFIKNLSNQVQLEYLYRFLSRLNIGILAEVSAQPKITQDILNHVKVQFPEDLDEQKQIASILSGVDAPDRACLIIATILRMRLGILLILFAAVLNHEFHNTEKDLHNRHNF